VAAWRLYNFGTPLPLECQQIQGFQPFATYFPRMFHAFVDVSRIYTFGVYNVFPPFVDSINFGCINFSAVSSVV
jgi:hypothetical protein